MPSVFLEGMREDIESLVTEWGKTCGVTRLSASLNGQGRLSGSFASIVASEQLWIQPIEGMSRVVDFGINDETTHLAWQKHDGTVLRPKDRVLVVGESFAYDVLYVHVKESHRVMELKQITRT